MSYSCFMLLLYPALLAFYSHIDWSDAIVDFLSNYIADLGLILHMDGGNNGGGNVPGDTGDNPNPNPGDPQKPNNDDNIKPIREDDGEKEYNFVAEDASQYADSDPNTTVKEGDDDHKKVDDCNAFLNSYNTPSNNLPETAEKLDRGEFVEEHKINAFTALVGNSPGQTHQEALNNKIAHATDELENARARIAARENAEDSEDDDYE